MNIYTVILTKPSIHDDSYEVSKAIGQLINMSE